MTEENNADTEHDFVPKGRARTAQISILALLLAALVTAVFVSQNTADAHVRFLVWALTIPLAAALLFAAALGGLLAYLIVYLRQAQFRRAVRKEHEAHGE